MSANEQSEVIGNNRHAELDYLRGLACMIVVAYHYLYRGPHAGWTGRATFPWAGSAFSHGDLGVKLFFMISGFVIYKSANGRSSGEFVKARFWRLYPTYWSAMLITSAFVIGCGAHAFAISTRDFLLDLTMLQDLFHASSVDGAYWSLLVEILFYSYVAIAIRLGLISRTYLLVAGWLCIAAANLIIRSYYGDALILANWGPYFAIGILAYRLRAGDKWPLPSLMLFAAISIACLRTWLDADDLGNAERLMEPVLVAIFSVAFVWIVSKPRPMAATRASKLFGDLSYPVYLIHQNIGYILIAALGTSFGSNSAVLLSFLIVLGLGLALNLFVEKRLKHYLRAVWPWTMSNNS